tara:strand:+ start:7660 stop:8064 length:405 start_codon:yes stop_codon:yes gene_type:complete
MGALTLAINNRGNAGDLWYAEVTATFSSSYATGGDTGLTAAFLGWDAVYVGIVSTQEDGFTFQYNMANGKLLAYQMGFTSNSVVAGDDTRIMSTSSTIGVSGTGTAFQQALSQVTNATDLSTTPGAVRLLLFGK